MLLKRLFQQTLEIYCAQSIYCTTEVLHSCKKKFRPAKAGIKKKGKRAKGQRAIQEPWGGNSQDENQN